MVAQRQSGGPGLSSFRMTWEGSRVLGQIQSNIRTDAEQLARDLENYLHATLHRDSGEMADKAFARVEIVGDRIVIRAGSDADQTIYHELIYHPQLRQTLDTWAPKISQYIRDAARGLP